jgi:Co/Zn/Cd efflux system component
MTINVIITCMDRCICIAVYTIILKQGGLRIMKHSIILRIEYDDEYNHIDKIIKDIKNNVSGVTNVIVQERI